MWTIVGEKFSRERNGRTVFWYPCRCTCGKERDVESGNVNPPLSSFGCKSCCNGHFRHGRSVKTDGKLPRDFTMWLNMMSRCYDETADRYPRYGGRGIKVCERWHDAGVFLADLESEIGLRPSPKHSIDRINNDGNYEPGNVRWATNREQSWNKSDSRMLTFNGETMCLSAWALKLGINVGTLKRRINAGWSVDDALTGAVAGRPLPIRLTYDGAERSFAEWAAITGIAEAKIRHRINARWTVGQALGFESKPVRPRGKTIKGQRKKWLEGPIDGAVVRIASDLEGQAP